MGIRTLSSAMLVQCSTTAIRPIWRVNYEPLDVEIDDDSTGIFHVFEMQIRVNDIDHRI